MRFGRHTVVPISWMCKKQTSVSHSSTESEIISLDAGLRLDGFPALDLWDLIFLVLGNTNQNHDRTGRPVVCRDKNHVRHQSQGMFNVLNNVDSVQSNVQFSHQEALLYVFEDNEAVIKMIIKGRSPTINLDPKNPNQVHRHQKPTCRHSNQGKVHTWRMESSVVFVQYQPFQFYNLFLSDGKNTSTRFRRIASHSEIATNDESYSKGSLESIVLDVRKPGEEKLWKSKSLECES